jgi:hypothetical protein
MAVPLQLVTSLQCFAAGLPLLINGARIFLFENHLVVRICVYVTPTESSLGGFPFDPHLLSLLVLNC